MSEKKPTIMIGAPVYTGVSPEVLEDWMRFAYHLGRRMPEYDFMLGIKSKSEQFRARNAIVEAARKTRAEWLLMLDDDMIINPAVTMGPTDEYDFIRTLIAHDKDICGILYYQRGGACRPVLMNKLPEADGYRFLRDDEIEGRLQQVDVAGGGCLLIRMSIFDQIAPPYFSAEHEFGTDIQLARRAAEAGFTVWADTSIEFGHQKSERIVVTSQNRLQLQASDSFPGEMRKSFLMADIFSRLKADAQEYTGMKMDDLNRVANEFMAWRGDRYKDMSDIEWYQQFPTERICRQVWYNTESPSKRYITELILNSIDHQKQHDILDFGCGIGITAFTLAERGHRVRALDVKGTGTLEFLRWRAKKHKLSIQFQETEYDVPALDSAKFDVIIAMDSLEHIQHWKWALEVLARSLRTGGILFSNNAILEDDIHPEHYPLGNREFVNACMEYDLMPLNQIMYQKREVKSHESTDQKPDDVLQHAR